MFNLENDLRDLKIKGRLRVLKPHQGIDFSSNDYLGISQSNILKESILNFVDSDKYLWHTSSRLISGTTEYGLSVEEKIAHFLGREASLIFNSGYSANCGVISTLCKDSLIFSDELNHASLIEGIKLSKSECVIFPHTDLDTLEEYLENYKNDSRKKYIITESIFSMDGTHVDLIKLFSLCQKYQLFLILDEAHSTGIYGKNGRGLFDGHIFSNERLITIHTGGKALGAYGAFIGCSNRIKNYLINYCRHFIYTTALPPINIFILDKSIELVSQNDEYREKLFKNIKTFKAFMEIDHQQLSPIIPFLMPGNAKVLNASKYLLSKGVNVKAIRYPTVPLNEERLRVSIHSHHTENQINTLCDRLSELEFHQ